MSLMFKNFLLPFLGKTVLLALKSQWLCPGYVAEKLKGSGGEGVRGSPSCTK